MVTDQLLLVLHLNQHLLLLTAAEDTAAHQRHLAEEVEQHLLLLVHLLAEDMKVADSLLNHLVEVTATEVTAAVVKAVEDLPAADTDRPLVLSPQRQFNPEATEEVVVVEGYGSALPPPPTAAGAEVDTTKADRHLPLVHQQADLAMVDPSNSNKEATVELAEGEAVTAKAEVRPTFARLPQSVQIGDEMKKKESGKGKGKRKEKVDAGQSSITNRTCHMQPD